MPPKIQILRDRYRLRKQVGNNAGRQTWLAQDLTTTPPSPVIVKLLAFSPQMQWEEFKLFEREAQVLKSLKHPRLPRYRDSFSIDAREREGLHWFALVHDYIPGKSLQQLLDEGYRFNEQQIRFLAAQILKILRDLHGLNPPILHRDLKPSNLILGSSPTSPLGKGGHRGVYLIDLGAVCEATTVEGATFTVVGTAGYAPLEQFWGKAVPASDLYALGATLIHLATGIPPSELPQANLRVQFRDKVSLDPQFVNWLEVLSDPNLERRFASAQQALNTLKAGLAIAPPQKPESSRIQLKKSQDTLHIELPRSPLSAGNILRLVCRFIVLILACFSFFALFALMTGLLLFYFVSFVLMTGSAFLGFLNNNVLSAILLMILLLHFWGVGLFALSLNKNKQNKNQSLTLGSLAEFYNLRGLKHVCSVQLKEFSKETSNYFGDHWLEVKKQKISSKTLFVLVTQFDTLFALSTRFDPKKCFFGNQIVSTLFHESDLQKNTPKSAIARKLEPFLSEYKLTKDEHKWLFYEIEAWLNSTR
ncbi:MAG: protein kinase [Cyanobacteriota bacterium]|nr:protein kinase [Cyanobacteriota bacterium]